MLSVTEIGTIHVAFAVAAMASGAVVLTKPKGTRFHRRTGRVYALSMVALNVTALMIYRLFGHFGPFHVLALVSLISVVLGVIPVFLRRPKDRWLDVHYGFITGSYLGLIAAFAAEIAVRVPAIRPRSGAAFAVVVIGASLLICVLGGYLIARGKRTTLARFTTGRFRAAAAAR